MENKKAITQAMCLELERQAKLANDGVPCLTTGPNGVLIRVFVEFDFYAVFEAGLSKMHNAARK